MKRVTVSLKCHPHNVDHLIRLWQLCEDTDSAEIQEVVPAIWHMIGMLRYHSWNYDDLTDEQRELLKRWLPEGDYKVILEWESAEGSA